MKKFVYFTSVMLGIFSLFTTVSCIDNDPDRKNYYTFTGQTIASNLQEDKHGFGFSKFIEVLERADLMDLLSTYGDFTCFAPTDEAIDQFLKEKGYATVDDMPKAECDTLAWMHVLKAAYFISDCDEGSLPSTNMNGRYLTMSCDTLGNRGGNAVWRVNGSELMAQDDSVTNGVVHVINQVIQASTILTGELVCADPNLKIFGEALLLTGLSDSMVVRYDENYKVDPDLAIVTKDSHHLRVFGGNDTYWRYPATREFKYTIFAEPDSIYNKRGIKDINDLIAYAKKVYDNTYPKDAGKYDNDYTNRRNPLNRFVAYHILDRETTYSEMTVSNYQQINTYFQTQLQDIMEFYETMCPYTILKVSDTPDGQKYLNRRGLAAKYTVRGCRILKESESKALNPNYSNSPNGAYFYIDDILEYDQEKTIDQVLNIRMRIDATTLSPDFANAGARNSNAAEQTGIKDYLFFMMRFQPGFTKNFIFSDKTFYGVHSRVGYFNSWEGDNNACLDNFDIKFKIPPVPANMTYEVRLGYTVGEKRTVVQVYFDDNLTGDMPCGIPVDLRKYGPEYGWQSDEELGNDPDKIEANDKALRNNGYMKAYDSYFLGGGTNPRTQVQCLRRILTTKYLEPEHDYYIRLRQVLDNNAEMSLDYIELVPKSVYDGPEAEDKH